MLLVAAFGCQEATAPEPKVTPIDISEIQERIRLMKVVQEELVLTRNIINLRMDLAKIKASMDPNNE